MDYKNNEKLFFDNRVNNLFNQPLLFILFCQTSMIFLSAWYLSSTGSSRLILTWLVLSLFATLGMIILILSYRKSGTTQQHNQLWLSLFMIAIVANGFIWSAPALFPHTFDSANSVLFLSIMLLGVVAAALPVMSTFSILFTIFSLLALLPITIRFFLSDQALYNIFGFMYVVYFGVQLLSSRNMQNVMLKSLRLGFENIDLVKNLKIQNNQAEQARIEAEQANVTKSKFLAAASHDLRQPMHALGLFVSKINNEQCYPEIKEDIQNIKKSSDALEGLLNSLLDISKLDAGVLTPDISSFNLQTVLDKVIVNGQSKANNKGLHFHHRKTNKVVMSDMLMLQRILNNLVSNAIRYTATGSIFIGCRRRNNTLRIEVRDSGIGIANDELGDIFEEFYQSENPERDRSKGLGLGLAIVERLCNLLDHKLDVRSAPDKGSVFSVEVLMSHEQISDATTPSSTENFTSDVEGLHVLVIDDEALIRKATASTLEEWGCAALLADSAENAIDLLQQNNFIPDIILSDYRLRENKTGVDAIQKVNQFCKKDIPAIIVTGDTAADRLQEAKDSGYHLLNKPLSPAKLRSVMSYLREQNR